MAEGINPFSTETTRNDNYKSGIFIMPFSSKNTKQEKSRTTTAPVYTSPSAAVITSPQINIQPLPAVSVPAAGTEAAIPTGAGTSVPQINDLTKTAVEQGGAEAAPLPGDYADKRENEILLPAEAGEAAGSMGGDGDYLTAVGKPAGEKRLSGGTGAEESFYSSSWTRDTEEGPEGFTAGRSEVDQVLEQGREEDRVRLETADEGRSRQDYLAALLQAWGKGRTALRAAARSEKGGGNGEDQFYFESDDDNGGGEEDDYAGYYYNAGMPGKGRRRRKIIEPLKELFYKVSYFSEKER